VRPFTDAIEHGFVRSGASSRLTSDVEDASGETRPSSRVTRLTLFLLIAIVGATGIAGLAYITGYETGPHDWEMLLVLAGLAVIAERTDFSMYGASRVSLAFVPIFASVLCCGPIGLAIVVPAAVLASAWGRPWYKTLFNFGTLMVAGLAANLVLESFAEMDYTSDWPQILVPAGLAGAVNFAINSALVAAAISLSTRASLRSVWTENFMWLLPHYLILSLIAVAVVATYYAMGIWGIAVFLAPPLMMRLSIKQYVDRTTNSVLELRKTHVQLQHGHDRLTAAMTSLGNAYDGTLRSLVAALDARDSETAGHSERVADLTMAIAAEMGIPNDTDEWRCISWGALLHDVGKIAIPDHVLRKPGPLSDEEWENMRTHAQTGFEILSSVDFLRPASDIVLAHHERYDGTGYPRNLAGEDIPLGARIFAIADAFDAMTSDRIYRDAMPAEQALAEILRNSGTQFDPAAVRAFLSVYQKRFVGTVHHRHFAGSSAGRGSKLELSDSLKRAIAEAAGLNGDDI
jgi:putative nucleotidyltransferase with HDIG domain